MESIFLEQLRSHQQVMESLAEGLTTVRQAAKLMIRTLKKGRKILLCGNGGSAADSQHMAAELVVRFRADRPGLPAVSLTTDTSILTAAANDLGFENVFRRQVEALGKRGDILIAFTTSGRSPNILGALDTARSLGMRTILFTGKKGEILKDRADVLIAVNSMDTPRIQEAHGFIAHVLCDLVEMAFLKP